MCTRYKHGHVNWEWLADYNPLEFIRGTEFLDTKNVMNKLRKKISSRRQQENMRQKDFDRRSRQLQLWTPTTPVTSLTWKEEFGENTRRSPHLLSCGTEGWRELGMWIFPSKRFPTTREIRCSYPKNFILAILFPENFGGHIYTFCSGLQKLRNLNAPWFFD